MPIIVLSAVGEEEAPAALCASPICGAKVEAGDGELIRTDPGVDYRIAL
jgi:hypothetical protein